MLRALENRLGTYLLLFVVWASLCLPNLGGPSLWDIDEGNNAECAMEMYESGNFIVPTFNYKLRVDKPVLLYWLQVAAYHCCGVNEFAARLPSALAAGLTLLVLCELGGCLFGRMVGLLGALIFASSIAFCAAAHFANPDALLNLFILLTLYCFWRQYANPASWWIVGAGAASGFGMLAKGPVAILLPVAIALLFLGCRREWRRWCNGKLLVASLIFFAVAAPWYIWVGLETKGEWLVGFFWRHNIQRSLDAMENHRGPFFYYALVLIVGLSPWSIFLGPSSWFTWKRLLPDAEASETGQQSRAARQFLLCWIAVWLVFFTLVRTKLPNYILPAYPAIALLTASFLDDWRRGLVTLPNWVMATSLGCLAVAGIGVSAGLLVCSENGPFAFVRHRIAGLEAGCWLGVVLLTGAIFAGRCWRLDRRGLGVVCILLTGVGFNAALSFWGVKLIDRFKAPRALVEALPRDHLRREVRVGAYDYFQPSLVFYAHREVYCPANPVFAVEFLHSPLPVYFFVSEEMWNQLRHFAPTTYHLIARHTDLYNGHEILLVTNDAVK